MKTEIFKDQLEFDARPDKTINGCDQKHFNQYGFTGKNNRACWNCLNCSDCSNCVECTSCSNCSNCLKIYNCINCNLVNYSEECKGCNSIEWGSYITAG